MSRAAHAAIVLALMLAACGKGTGGYSGTGPIIPIGGGSQGPDGGDGGTDAGTDAGTDGGIPDGGCAGFNARPIDRATDFCNGVANPPATPLAAAVDSACSVSITLGDGVVCTGRISGVFDAFDGGCQTNSGLLSCNSASLPGTVSCDAGSPSTCSIIFCNGASCVQ